MDRRLIFPAVAITAWAQQPSIPTAEAETALRARVQEFFQLQVDKKYRQGEAMVAETSKDDYYNGNKYNIKSFTIQNVELLDNNTRAKVTIKAKVTLRAAAIGEMDFDAPITTPWKVENGQWVWYTEPGAPVQTPFGAIHPGQAGDKPPQLNKSGAAPDLATLQSAVKIDRDSVSLTSDMPLQTVTVSNDLPGGVDLELSSDKIPGLSAELDKKHLERGEKTVIRFRATGKEKGSGIVRLLISPIAATLNISVDLN